MKTQQLVGAVVVAAAVGLGLYVMTRKRSKRSKPGEPREETADAKALSSDGSGAMPSSWANGCLFS
jgi:hypothetical protein